MTRELIVVEGEKDAQVVRRAVPQADVMVTGGWGLSLAQIKVLQQAQKRRGIIILTDPDFAGEQIRRRLAALLPGCKHAYIAREQATRNGRTGVEHATEEIVAKALQAVRTQGGRRGEFTMNDLLQHKLAGAPEAASRRRRVGAILAIGYGNAKQFLWRLNALGVSREEFICALGEVEVETNGSDQAKRNSGHA